MILGILPVAKWMEKHGYEAERFEHERFKGHRLGAEWFAPSSEIYAHIFHSGAHANLWNMFRKFRQVCTLERRTVYKASKREKV